MTKGKKKAQMSSAVRVRCQRTTYDDDDDDDEEVETSSKESLAQAGSCAWLVTRCR